MLFEKRKSFFSCAFNREFEKMHHKEPPFSEGELTAIANCIDSAATHAELDSLFRDVGLIQPTRHESLSKWKRIYNALANAQNQTKTGNLAMGLPPDLVLTRVRGTVK